MIAHVYYMLFLFVGVICELQGVRDPSERIEYSKRIKGKGWNDWSEKDRANSAWNITYLLLGFLGIASDQWPAFLALHIMSFVPKRWVPHVFLDSVVSIVIIVAMVINHFHFKTNLLGLLF